jgi:hypothetical protein
MLPEEITQRRFDESERRFVAAGFAPIAGRMDCPLDQFNLLLGHRCVLRWKPRPSGRGRR